MHDLQHQRVLSDAWMIRAAGEVTHGGAELSRPGPDTDGWLPASVPGTVLATLVANGKYEDPYVGMNLREIPEEPFRAPWWYRTQFVLSEAEAGQTVLLEFDGINYAADIWLNGRQVTSTGELRGAFRRFQYDVTGLVTPGENVLAVQVVPPKPGDFTIGFVDWNPPAPDRNMGIFRPVRLRFCDSVSIEHPFVQTRLNLDTLAEAHLTVCADLVNHTDRAVSGVLEGYVETTAFRQDVHVQAGETKTVTFTADQYSQLHVVKPRLWWPHDLGKPELYSLDLRFVAGSRISDRTSVRFGIRDVADYWTAQGHRGFKVNGRQVLIKGAGWTDDLLLADTPETIAAELQYVRHMNLNCIRCENVWGKDQTLYDLCDEYGILMMVGWSCQWEHEQYLGKPVDERYGGVTSPEDIELVSRSWQDQLLWLRRHPSIFVWAVASDKLPAPDLEKRYIDIFQKYDPTRSYLASTGGVGSEQQIVCRAELVSEVSGSSGVKMLGPYEYTPPVYWYTDSRRGGAYGFNTETAPGAVVPTLESIKKTIPPEHLWPVDEYWDFHCGLNEFNKLDRYREALAKRYGAASSVEEFARKAQVLNYELMRPMFEAFRVNQGRATGVIQWMLNAAWPKMYWQLHDWYLIPTGAFYGVKKACEPLQLVYHYGDNCVYLVGAGPCACPDDFWATTGSGSQTRKDRIWGPGCPYVDIRIYDIESRLFFATHFQVAADGGPSKRILRLPRFDHLSAAYFLSLRLLHPDGTEVANNFYWLSTKRDVPDYQAKVVPWEYYTPSRRYADLTMLNSLPPTHIGVQQRIEVDGSRSTVTVNLQNHSDKIAFAIELLVAEESTGKPVVPILWEDNYVSLLPNETRVLAATFPAAGQKPVLQVRGWNIEPFVVCP